MLSIILTILELVPLQKAKVFAVNTILTTAEPHVDSVGNSSRNCKTSKQASFFPLEAPNSYVISHVKTFSLNVSRGNIERKRFVL